MSHHNSSTTQPSAAGGDHHSRSFFPSLVNRVARDWSRGPLPGNASFLPPEPPGRYAAKGVRHRGRDRGGEFCQQPVAGMKGLRRKSTQDYTGSHVQKTHPICLDRCCSTCPVLPGSDDSALDRGCTRRVGHGAEGCSDSHGLSSGSNRGLRSSNGDSAWRRLRGAGATRGP